MENIACEDAKKSVLSLHVVLMLLFFSDCLLHLQRWIWPKAAMPWVFLLGQPKASPAGLSFPGKA
jgi:hypothetical protein